MDRCHYIKHDGMSVLIPGCIGTAVNGIDRCTCNTDRTRDATRIETLMETVRRLEERVDNLERRLEVKTNRTARRTLAETDQHA